VHSQHTDELLRFLLRAGEELANSLDYETTLQSVAHQAVPVLADVCVVDLIGSDGRLRPVAAAHVEAAREPWLRELALGDESPATVLRAFRTRQPLFVPELSESVLNAIACDEHAPVSPRAMTAIQVLRAKSAIAVPLVARERALGVLLPIALWRAGDHSRSAYFCPSLRRWPMARHPAGPTSFRIRLVDRPASSRAAKVWRGSADLSLR